MASKSNNPADFGGFGTYVVTAGNAFGWPIWVNEHGFEAQMTERGFVSFSKDGEDRNMFGTAKGASCFAPTADEPAGKWNLWTGTHTEYG